MLTKQLAATATSNSRPNARCVRVLSMRAAIRQDKDIALCKHLPPDLSDCDNCEDHTMLLLYWRRYVGAVVYACKNTVRYIYDS